MYAMIRPTAQMDQRRFSRLPYACRVEYTHAPDESAEAMTMDVGRGGMQIRLGRYLRPGTKLLLRVPCPAGAGSTAELKAEIVWCRLPRRGEECVAGLRIMYDEPEVLISVSRLIHEAIFRLGQVTVAGRATKATHHPRHGWEWSEREGTGAFTSASASANGMDWKRSSGGPEAY